MMKRKILVSAVLTAVLASVFAYTNCSKQESTEDGDARVFACEDVTPRAARVTTYGAFNPAMLDACHAFTGTTSRWTGMSTSIAHVALPAVMFGGGTACGACVKVTGAQGSVTARVAANCPSCAADQIDMDEPSFNAITNGAGSGIFNVQVQSIPCPVTEGVRYAMNAGTNPFYLNLSPANFKHPVDTVQVNFGSGFNAMARTADSNDFFINTGGPVGATVQIKATDIYGQVIQSTINPAPAAETLTSEQFGDCR